MQVSSSNLSKLSSVPLALQPARPRGMGEPTVEAVGERSEPQERFTQPPAHSTSIAHLDSGTEKNLGRIKEVQTAFQAALNITTSIEEQYLLDPII